jgi:hypothetical protein
LTYLKLSKRCFTGMPSVCYRKTPSQPTKILGRSSMDIFVCRGSSNQLIKFSQQLQLITLHHFPMLPQCAPKYSAEKVPDTE